jgi:hypothetical protein
LIAEEFRNILGAKIEGRKLNIKILYDLSVSPKTFGDFIYAIFLSKVLCHLGNNVDLVVCTICDSRKKFQNDNFFNQIEKISEKILRNYSFKLTFLNIKSKDKKCLYETHFSSDYILFKDKVKKGLPIYKYSFDLISILSSSIDRKELIIENNDLGFALPEPFKDNDYIAIHFRYNPDYGLDRNISFEDSLKILNRINEFSKDNILIVSDKLGCIRFKEWFSNLQIENNIFYSKDYSDDLIEDWNLMINSKIFLQYKGGGTAPIIVFSKIPYLIYTEKVIHESRITPINIASWARQNQYWVSSIDLDDFLKDIDLFASVLKL